MAMTKHALDQINEYLINAQSQLATVQGLIELATKKTGELSELLTPEPERNEEA